MVDDQSMNEWQDGFLVKGPGGSFTRVQNDESLDVVSGATRPVPPPVATPKPMPAQPAVPSPAVPRPAVKPVAVQNAPMPFRPSPPVQDLGSVPTPFIDRADEEEIKRHAAELQKMVAQPGVDAVVTAQTIIDGAIRKHGLTFENDVMLKRFSKVLESYIRGLRNAIETQDVLQRQTKIGGLAIEASVAAAVMESVVAETDRLHQPVSGTKTRTYQAPQPVEKPAQPQGMYAAAPPAFVPRPGGAAPALRGEPAAPAKPVMPADMAAALAAIRPSVAPVAPAPIIAPVPQPPARPAMPFPETPRPAAPTHELYGQSDQSMPRIRQSMRQDKPQMIDIRQPIGVVGPVEEVHQIDLQEFRRLATNPVESADKVYEKIELLEEESWEMRMQAVQAWRTSPLFLLYLSIGRESMDENTAVGEVIRKRREAQQPFLLAEEFNAINTLNARFAT